MAKTPLLVALVSLYNSGRWLRNRLLNLMQTNIYQRGELLIYCANAQSPDPDDDKICNEFASCPNFRYEIIGKCTVYGAWNWMIRRTETEFITNANSDDIVAPDAYDKLIDACRTYDAILAYPHWYSLGHPNMTWAEAAQGTPNYTAQYNPALDHMSCGHFPLWRRSLHDQIGMFDPTFAALGDADLWIRAWKSGIRNFFLYHEALGGYYWRDGQNLWHATPEDQRGREWAILHSRQPGKLEFDHPFG